MRKQLLLLLFSVIAMTGYARIVTGVVTQKSDGETVIGASIQVKGTSRGTATDIDGKYSIEVNDGEVLEISYVGMNPVSIKVNGQKVINVELEDNSQVLQEVVVTAYGQTQEKKKLKLRPGNCRRLGQLCQLPARKSCWSASGYRRWLAQLLDAAHHSRHQLGQQLSEQRAADGSRWCGTSW